jgi:hypothetical protein
LAFRETDHDEPAGGEQKYGAQEGSDEGDHISKIAHDLSSVKKNWPDRRSLSDVLPIGDWSPRLVIA